MSKNMDAFKEYVKRNPSLKNEVFSNKKTWQQIYENFIILGEDGTEESKETTQQETKKTTKSTDTKSSSTEDMIKNVLGYVKKIDPDNVTKYVTSIQKVLELLASFGAGATTAAATKSTLDPLFDKKFDEWY